MGNNLTYTNIQHGFRKAHGLSCNEYVILDMIYHLQVSPKSAVKDWCYMKREQMAQEIGISKQGLLNIIHKLIEQGFLLKNEETKYLQTTEKWYCVYFTDGKESLPKVNFLDQNSVKKVDPLGKESLPNSVKKVYPLGKESLPDTISNNNIYNNRDNNKNNNSNFFQKNSEKNQTEEIQVLEVFEKKEKEKSCAKKERAHPCDCTKMFGEYIPRHGDGELHEMMLEYVNENPDKYPREMLTDFKAHWTAKVISGKKSEIGKEKWRTEKTFEISLRLATWKRISESQKSNQNATTTKNQQSTFDAQAVFDEAMAISRAREEQRQQYFGIHSSGF